MLRKALIALSVLCLPALGVAPIGPTAALAQEPPTLPSDPAPSAPPPQSPDPSQQEGAPNESVPPIIPLLPRRGRDCEHEQPPVVS